MLGTAVLPPSSVQNPTEWALQNGERYFIKTMDSFIHLSVRMVPGNQGMPNYACLTNNNLSDQIKRRLYYRKWGNKECRLGPLRERPDDDQRSIDVLVLDTEGLSVADSKLIGV